MKTGSIRKPLMFASGTLFALAVVALATPTTWYSSPGRVEVQHNQGGPTTIWLDIGPSASGTVSAKVNFSNTRTAPSPSVSSCVLQYAIDSNSDGIAQMNEWTTVGVTALTTVGSTTSGNTGVVQVPQSADGLRILVNDPLLGGYYSEDFSWGDVQTSTMYD